MTNTIQLATYVLQLALMLKNCALPQVSARGLQAVVLSLLSGS